jgi:hypothetical protein
MTMRPLRPPRATLWTALSLAAVLAAVPAGAAEPFSHADWERVLERFVDARGFVDYQGLAEDRGTLDRYLARLRAASPESDPGLFPSRDHELAYWINAYNAWVFWGVLDRGPDLDSVWGFLGTGISFFSGMDIELGGRETNLKALEDEVIRARYGDARIHAALNCASVSCPRLPRHAFTGEELDAQLDAAMREFVTDPKHLRVDRGAKRVTLSKIFDWYADDFLADAAERGIREPNLLDYVNLHRGAAGTIPRTWEIAFFDYDKGLNRQR